MGEIAKHWMTASFHKDGSWAVQTEPGAEPFEV